jgi:large subunit ribosomal protein L9
MKVLLLKDVYKLGRAGDVKKVADGYGRNFLLPQGLAVLATSGALKQQEHIRTRATAERAALNEEMSSVAEHLKGLELTFPAKAGETGKLYGSITTTMIAEAIQEKMGVEIDRRQIEAQPLRNLGKHEVEIRLTVDLIPTISVIVHREGESPESVLEEETVEAVAEEGEAPAEVEVSSEAEISADAETLTAEEQVVETTEAEEAPAE